MTYCPNCGSTAHPVGACPSLSNPDWPAQHAARMREAGRAAAQHAPGGSDAGGGCLMVLLTWAVVLALLLAGLLTWL